MILRIKHLRARAFRGIGRELGLPVNGKSLVLYGDSGTGKSSVVEVVEHAFTGRVESLDDRGQQVSFARYGTHTTMPTGDRLAQVTVTDGRCDYVLADGTSSDESENVKAFIRAAREGTFILRRSKLLDFIENAPRDRYEALRPFLGLRDFEAFERALKEAAEDRGRGSEKAAAEARSFESSFRAVVGLSDGADLRKEAVLKHLSECLAPIGKPPVKSERDVRDRVKTIGKLLERYGDISAYQKIHECRTRISDFLGTVPKREDIEKAIEKERELQRVEKELPGAFYEEVLASGRKWIKEECRQNCPLCEQPIPDVEALCQRIQARIDENAKVIAARAELRRVVPAVRTSLKLAVERSEKAIAAWKALGLPKEDWPLSDIVEGLTVLSTAVGVEDRVSDIDAAKQASERLAPEKADGLRKRAEETLKIKDGELPDRGKVEELIQAKGRCQMFLEQFKEVCRYGERALGASKIAGRLGKLHQTAVDARKQASREAFAGISAEVGRIYEQFHPGEDVGDLRLDVRDYGEGGAYLKGRFADRRDEDPRGLFSEAHLDTLGLAVFLALRKRDVALNPSFGVVILDDVLSSVDAPHRRRVAGYLLSEFPDSFQLMITTHNRQWFEWLIHLQNIRGVADRFVNKRILSWCLGDGPELVQLMEDYEFVRSHRDDSGHEFVVPIAGRVLEHVLQETRYTLELAIPAKPDERYTIGDIWGKFCSTVRRKYKPLWREIKEACKELGDTAIIRNWGTHSNDWARSLSRPEAMEFIDAVLFLFGQVYCQTCSSFVRICKAPQHGVSCNKGCLSYLPASASEVDPEEARAEETSTESQVSQ